MRIRTLVMLISVAVYSALGAAFWVWVLDPSLRHTEFSRATCAEFESLAQKRPPSITRKQWHHIVGKTLNGFIHDDHLLAPLVRRICYGNARRWLCPAGIGPRGVIVSR